jgi:hypothetical protein
VTKVVGDGFVRFVRLIVYLPLVDHQQHFPAVITPLLSSQAKPKQIETKHYHQVTAKT